MTEVGPWPYDDLRAALDLDVTLGATDAVTEARWLADHPDGVLTAEDFADRPAGLPPTLGDTCDSRADA